jgi:hypothetical protein
MQLLAFISLVMDLEEMGHVDSDYIPIINHLVICLSTARRGLRLKFFRIQEEIHGKLAITLSK